MAEPVKNLARSRDGTEIAYFTSGTGPPLLMISGTTADHSRWAPLLPHLEPHLTVHAMDRRGRGASGDTGPFSIDREYEDVAAVVDAIAESSGSTVSVYGHSFGGLCAFGAAPLTSRICKLAVYEGWPTSDPAVLGLPPDVDERLDQLLADGDREGVIETFFSEVLGMSDEQLGTMRAQPSWPARVAAAHTIRRESEAERTTRLDPAALAKITVAVLLLIGSDTEGSFVVDVETIAAALPDARVSSMPGQTHMADVFAPQLVAERLLPFVRG